MNTDLMLKLLQLTHSSESIGMLQKQPHSVKWIGFSDEDIFAADTLASILSFEMYSKL